MWKFKRILLVALFVIGAIISPALVQAEESLPEGGDGFSSATTLNLNTDYRYDGNWLVGGEKIYYKIEGVKAGQALTITTLLNTDVEYQNVYEALYNMDRDELDTEGEGNKITLGWMPSTEQDYYLRLETTDVAGGYGGTKADFNINIETTDYFDAGSDTDAGDKLTEAMELPTSTITGYLSGERDNEEADIRDFYKVDVDKGKTLSLKLTPPAEAWGAIDIFNSDRERLEREEASNQGSIVNLDFTPEEAGEYYIAIEGVTQSDELVEYTLETETKEATEEATEGSTETPSGDMPSEEEMQDIQNQIENQINGEGTEGLIDTVKGMVFNIIKYIAIVLGAIILVIVVIIVLIKKGKSGKKKEKKDKKEKPEKKEQE